MVEINAIRIRTILAICGVLFGIVWLSGCSIDKEDGVTASTIMDELYENLNIQNCECVVDTDEVNKLFASYTNLSSKQVIDLIIENSEIRIDEDLVVSYASEVGVSLTSDYILYQDLTFEEYLSSYFGVDAHTFFEECYKAAMYDISYYLVIGTLAKDSEFVVRDTDIIAWCDLNGVSLESLNSEDLNYVQYNVLERKVLELFGGYLGEEEE